MRARDNSWKRKTQRTPTAPLRLLKISWLPSKSPLLSSPAWKPWHTSIWTCAPSLLARDWSAPFANSNASSHSPSRWTASVPRAARPLGNGFRAGSPTRSRAWRCSWRTSMLTSTILLPRAYGGSSRRGCFTRSWNGFGGFMVIHPGLEKRHPFLRRIGFVRGLGRWMLSGWLRVWGRGLRILGLGSTELIKVGFGAWGLEGVIGNWQCCLQYLGYEWWWYHDELGSAFKMRSYLPRRSFSTLANFVLRYRLKPNKLL